MSAQVPPRTLDDMDNSTGTGTGGDTAVHPTAPPVGEGTLHEMWRTRPTRSPHDRIIGGVAAAIARRYGVDPLLVRVAFVVAAIAGMGGLVYVALYAALPPHPPGPAPAPPVTPPPHAVSRLALWVGLVVATIGDLFRLGFDGARVVVVPAVALLLLVLLHRNHATTSVAPAQQTGQWSATAPYPAVHRPPRPPVTSVTLAAALVAAGLVGVALLLGAPGGARLVLGVVLVVLAAGMVAGAFLHTGWGLVPVAVVVGLATSVVVTAPWQRWTQHRELRAAPTTVAELAPAYELPLGDIRLDLSRLGLGPLDPSGSDPSGSDTAADGAAGPVATHVSVDVGDIVVTVPHDADVTAVCSVGVGRVDCLGERAEGPGQDVRTTDLGADAAPGGRSLELTVDAGTGSVEVRRG